MQRRRTDVANPRLFTDALEALVAEGWAIAGEEPTRPPSRLTAAPSSASR